MRFARLTKRFLALPIRIKLTLWNALVVMCVAIAALVAVREGLRWMLVKELSVAIEDEVYEVSMTSDPSTDTAEELFAEMERTSSGHLRHGWFMELYGESDREPLWTSHDTPRALLQLPIDRAIEGGVRLADDGDKKYRFAERRLNRTGSPDYWVRVGTSTEFIEEDLRNVTRIITPVLLGILLLSPLGGFIVAGRATAPLQRIISTTRRLHPSRLEERFPVTGVGDELEQLVQEINHFLDQIADHLERNREFVANAAHELRSPLAAMTAAIEVVLSRSRSVEEYEELLGTISEECQQLTKLVNQLLLLAETEMHHSELPQQDVSLDRILRTCVDMYSGLAEDRGLELTSRIESDVVVTMNPMQIRQVVNNLIDNAIKFTPHGGRVSVQLTADMIAATATLTVRDSGIGIAPDDQARIFDRFYQVDASRQHDTILHGTGLGLSITRSIVQRHGGQINVTSRPGAGATFEVTLPLVRRPAAVVASVLGDE